MKTLLPFVCVSRSLISRGRPYEKRDQCNARAEEWGGRAKGAWAMAA